MIELQELEDGVYEVQRFDDKYYFQIENDKAKVWKNDVIMDLVDTKEKVQRMLTIPFKRKIKKIS